MGAMTVQRGSERAAQRIIVTSAVSSDSLTRRLRRRAGRPGRCASSQVADQDVGLSGAARREGGRRHRDAP